MKRIVVSAAAVLLMFLMCLGLAAPALAEGTAPIAENLELKTFRHISVGGALSAYDPDGEVVEYQITTPPVKGDVQLESDGSFVYTPYYNKKGRDYFGYKALDNDGNWSQEATVLVRIEKQKTPVWYEDMQGREGEYAAIALAEQGIFVGEQIGGRYCFQPEKPLTRGEFLTLCMLAAEKPILRGVMRTGGEEDETLPDWMKEYVASAALQGIEHSGAFEAMEMISRAEAARMLNAVLDYFPQNPDEKDETVRACLNLQAIGVMQKGSADESALTREEAARMLAAAADFVQ